MSAVRFMAFADRSCSFEQDAQEISRFSCMLFLSVRGFLDYAGPDNPLAICGTHSAGCLGESRGFSRGRCPRSGPIDLARAERPDSDAEWVVPGTDSVRHAGRRKTRTLLEGGICSFRK